METLKMKPHGMCGRLITFCGLDGCGKSAMIRRLSAYLSAKGADVVHTKEPSDNIRQMASFRAFTDTPEHEKYAYRAISLMAAADRVQHAHETVIPALRMGKTVISDRYFYSCLANLRARGYTRDRWIYEVSESIVRPNLAFFLDVPVPLAIARVRARPEEKERYIDPILQYRLQEAYREICRENGGILISSVGTEEETFAAVIAAWKGSDCCDE